MTLQFRQADAAGLYHTPATIDDPFLLSLPGPERDRLLERPDGRGRWRFDIHLSFTGGTAQPVAQACFGDDPHDGGDPMRIGMG